MEGGESMKSIRWGVPRTEVLARPGGVRPAPPLALQKGRFPGGFPEADENGTVRDEEGAFDEIPVLREEIERFGF